MNGAVAYRINPSDENHLKGENPVPYAEKGVDTPYSFNKKMESYKSVYSKEIPDMYYVSEDFKAGDSGVYDYVRNAGCDSLGLLTGAIGLTDDLKNKILGYEGALSGLNNNTFTTKTDYVSLLNSEDNKSSKIYESVKDLAEKSVRFNIYDLEKMTMLVPDYEKIRVGDILLNNGYSTSPVAIVTSVDPKKNGREGITIVCMEEKTGGYAVQKKWSELENSQKYSVRRLLKQKENASSAFVWGERNFKVGNSNTKPYLEDRRDFNCKLIKYGKINYGYMYEEFSQKWNPNEPGFSSGQNLINKITDWRWIPNTGEYLCLSGFSYTFYNNAGQEIPRWELYLEAKFIAKDRNYDASKTESATGNIYNNTDAGFAIAMGNDEKKSLNLILKKDKNNKELYSANSNIIIKHGIIESPNLLINLYIRPENAKDFRPGNDLILGLNVTQRGAYINYTEEYLCRNYNNFDVYMDDKDYLACYDKKALWRANLYIDEGVNDWNNQHPWDAPCNEKDTKKHQISLETAKAFGYNEWNLPLDANKVDITKDIFKGLDEIYKNYGSGNGKQVVKFPSFTPERTIAGTMENPSEANVISNTVAYSYPEHAHEKPLDNPGNSGSMDSPFDFIKKMLYQKRELNRWYNSNATKKESVSALNLNNNWIKFTAPQNSWYHYIVETSEENLNSKTFIPSLGTRIKYPTNAQNVKITDDTIVTEENVQNIKSQFLGLDSKGNTNVIEAGTDCIGFAQRSASYKNNNYSWVDSLPGWTEYTTQENKFEGTDDITVAQNQYSTNNPSKNYRGYPNTEADGVTEAYQVAYNIIHNKAGYDTQNYANFGTLNNDEKKKYSKMLSCIVPGDIFVKQGSSTSFNSHIALISSVPLEMDSDMDLNEILDEFVLIEAEINFRIQSVINKLTLKNYQDDSYNYRILETIYPGFNDYEFEEDITTYDTEKETHKLNSTHWAVRRLK